jgi:undecaprenyl diphosphate synthase
MQLFHRYLLGESARCRRNGIALRVIGRRDRLPAALVGAITSAERRTRAGSRMTLRLAVDYSSRWSLANACGSDDVRSAIAHANHDGSPMPDVDVLIRTGREKRLSDFLLWECSYAELFFLDTLWPDFTGDELARCVEEFRSRSRRFGAVEAQEAFHGVR